MCPFAKRLPAIITALLWAAAPVVMAQPAPAPVAFTIDAALDRHPISPLIYGVNSADLSDPRLRGVTFNRFGGNRTTAYNWETNASNAGQDYHHQNDDHLSHSRDPGAAVLATLVPTLKAGASHVVTVPMLGLVSADLQADGDVNQTPDYIHTRFVPSRPRKPAPFAESPDLTDGQVFQDEFVAFLKRRLPEGFGGPIARVSFMLDNEPDLWATTHPRLRGDAHGDHGAELTYAELFRLTRAYGEAIRDVAPNALIFGPASYGWNGYLSLQGAPDAGGRDFLDAYLDEMQAYAASHPRRLVDVLDLHWYPEARSSTGVRVTEASGALDVARARLQAPRSLYDPTYVEDSWISRSVGAIRLLPRMRDKIAAHDPGMKLSFSEYDFGGGGHISGGVAEADALGIFGREGVFAAAQWPQSPEMDFIYAGIAMFRNFDGQGAAFGDLSVSARTSAPADTAIYASLDSGNPDRMVLVMINRADRPKIAHTRLVQRRAAGHATLFRLSAAAPRPQAVGAVTTDGQTLTVPLPAWSVTTVAFVDGKASR